jgi:hypothetical protein
MAECSQEVMVVISALEFRRYLDNRSDPVTAAAAAHLPNFVANPGASEECDIVIIHKDYGVIVGEIKSVGVGQFFWSRSESEQNGLIIRQVLKAVNQLNSQAATLGRLVVDLGVRITKILILPNVTSALLTRAISTDYNAAQVSRFCPTFLHLFLIIISS